ncbi:class I SAM-dependent methyltransferase [Methylobacterium sp. CM6257]
MQTDTIFDSDGWTITLEPCGDRIRINVHDARARHHPFPELLTRYPRSLIEEFLRIKGPIWFTGEIARDEKSDYLEDIFTSAVLGYFDPDHLNHARILDFGCGRGASTVIIARRFPNAAIVATDIHNLKIAEARADFHGLRNIDFVQAPSGDVLPDGLGSFDCIILSAVYEHILPDERRRIFPQMWASLRKGGVMLIYETPNRWFPVETHTTGGLPLINYMPPKLALATARHSPFRDLKHQDWPTMLRNGIRGGSIGELRRLLPDAALLEPRKGDRIDLWLEVSGGGQGRRAFAVFARALNWVTGVELLPSLTVALQKK